MTSQNDTESLKLFPFPDIPTGINREK